MAHKVVKNLLGKHRVEYKCPHCSAELESPLEEAGQSFECPYCREKIRTPGTTELEQLRAAEAKQRTDAEERLRLAAEQAKLKQIERAAAAKLDADTRKQQEAREARERILHADALSAADRFLALAFKVAKGFSVLIVAACFVTIVVCAIIYFTTQANTSSATTVQLVIPSTEEYQRFLSVAAERRLEGPDNSARLDHPPTGGSQTDSLTERFARMLRRHNAYTFDEYIEFVQMDSAAQQLFVDGLETFLQALPKSVTPQQAISWYSESFRSRLTSIRSADAERRIANERAELAARTRKQAMLTIMGTALGALMGFLFLPLLIQIEQNTRRTLELHATEKRLAAGEGSEG
jgi:DNA-directed RNA polymerase subunit RPC12/RpoP